MTNPWTLITTMFRKKAASVHIVIGIQLIATVVSMIGLLWQHQFDATAPMVFSASFATIAVIVLFILLSRRTERVWTSNVYRLIPTSDTRLYLANICSTLLDFLYFIILEVVIITACSLTNIGAVNFPTDQSIFPYAASISILMLALIIYGWVFISLVHLIGRAITSFLPEGHHKIVNLVLYVVVVAIVWKILDMIDSGRNMLFSSLYNNDNHIVFGVLSFSGYLLIMIVIMSLLNIYLLKNWVETKQTA